MLFCWKCLTVAQTEDAMFVCSKSHRWYVQHTDSLIRVWFMSVWSNLATAKARGFKWWQGWRKYKRKFHFVMRKIATSTFNTDTHKCTQNSELIHSITSQWFKKTVYPAKQHRYCIYWTVIHHIKSHYVMVSCLLAYEYNLVMYILNLLFLESVGLRNTVYVLEFSMNKAYLLF